MAALYRKIKSKAAWDEADGVFSLHTGPFFDDLTPEPTSGALSMWRAHDDWDLFRAAAAVASTRDNLDKVDFAGLPERGLETIGLQPVSNPGTTPYGAANHLHRDVRLANAGALLLLADELAARPRCRVTRDEVTAILLAAIDAGEIDPTDLKPNLRLKLGK